MVLFTLLFVLIGAAIGGIVRTNGAFGWDAGYAVIGALVAGLMGAGFALLFEERRLPW